MEESHYVVNECTDDGALFMYSVSFVLLRCDGYTIFSCSFLRVTCGTELQHGNFTYWGMSYLSC